MGEFTRGIESLYDKQTDWKLNQEYYEHSDFLNYGYWEDSIKGTRQACENLLEKILDFIPEKRGKILDVACGKGSTTRYLMKYFDEKNITGINISQEHLKLCSEKLPDVSFFHMDAVNLDFSDESFDNIMCVEAAFLFDTREKFLWEALRVLKPGGHLIITDILRPRQFPRQLAANVVKDLDDYRNVYLRVGFADVEVIDATKPCTWGFADSLCRFAHEKTKKGEMGRVLFDRIWNVAQLTKATHSYLLVHATKK